MTTSTTNLPGNRTADELLAQVHAAEHTATWSIAEADTAMAADKPGTAAYHLQRAAVATRLARMRFLLYLDQRSAECRDCNGTGERGQPCTGGPDCPGLDERTTQASGSDRHLHWQPCPNPVTHPGGSQ